MGHRKAATPGESPERACGHVPAPRQICSPRVVPVSYRPPRRSCEGRLTCRITCVLGQRPTVRDSEGHSTCRTQTTALSKVRAFRHTASVHASGHGESEPISCRCPVSKTPQPEQGAEHGPKRPPWRAQLVLSSCVVDRACVTRRKLQTPGTAEEHKRQEAPTINPIDPTDTQGMCGVECAVNHVCGRRGRGR